MNSKEWVRSEVEQLIFAYKMKPMLWDVTCKEYKARVRTSRLEALKELADKFQTTTQEISRKIHNLRNQFNSEIKKSSKRSGQGTYMSSWPHFKNLMFLQRNYLHSSARSLVDADSITETGEQYPKENEDMMVALVHGIDPNNNRQDSFREQFKNKRQKTGTAKTNGRDSPFEPKKEDQYDVFGAYVASELRNLNSDYLRKKMKRTIQMTILEINDEFEQNETRSFYMASQQ